MRITQVETFVVKIPQPDDEWAGGAGLVGHIHQQAPGETTDYHQIAPYRPIYSKNIETLFVRISTDQGLFGIGECQAPVVPEVPQVIVDRLLAPLLIGENPLDSNPLWMRMYNAMRERGHTSSFMLDAISAVDIALWDLKGKTLGLPVYQLLGGSFRPTIPVYLSGLKGASLDERVQNALYWLEQGFTTIKLFLGRSIAQDIEEVRVVREAVGYQIDLMVDLHWMYSVSEAQEIGRALEKYQVKWLEAPTFVEDLQGHVELARSLNIPIAVGECQRSRFEFHPFLEHRAYDIIQPDIGRAGGITECMKIAALAETYHLHCAPHCGVGLCGYIAASVQFAAAIPNFLILEYQPAMHQVAWQLAESPFQLEQGQLQLSQSPGLGVVLKEDILNQLGYT